MLLLKTLIIVVQILSALAIIGLVLLQHGKGADMGAAFGSGSSGSLFGATGSANFLSRSTAVLAAVFFICTLALTYLGTYKPKDSAGLLGGVTTTAPVSASAPMLPPANVPTVPSNNAASTPAAASTASAAAGASQQVPK